MAGGLVAPIDTRRPGHGCDTPRVAARRARGWPPRLRGQHARRAQRSRGVRPDLPARLRVVVQGHGRGARAVQLLRPGLAPVLQEDRPSYPAVREQEHHLGAGGDRAPTGRAARPGRRGASLPGRVPHLVRPAPGADHPAAPADHDLGDPLGRDDRDLHRSRQQLRAHGGLAGLGAVRARPADGRGAGPYFRLQQRGHPAHRRSAEPRPRRETPPITRRSTCSARWESSGTTGSALRPACPTRKEGCTSRPPTSPAWVTCS